MWNAAAFLVFIEGGEGFSPGLGVLSHPPPHPVRQFTDLFCEGPTALRGPRVVFPPRPPE